MKQSLSRNDDDDGDDGSNTRERLIYRASHFPLFSLFCLR